MLLFLTGIAASLVGCGDIFSSKESYLSEYGSFIAEVRRGYKDFKPEQWKDFDAKFRKYSVELYTKHQTSLTSEEDLLTKKYALQYKMYRCAAGILISIRNFDTGAVTDTIGVMMALIKEASEISLDLAEEIDDKIVQKIIHEYEAKYDQDGIK